MGRMSMRVEYLGLKTVEGPLIVVEGVSGAQYEELSRSPCPMPMERSMNGSAEL